MNRFLLLCLFSGVAIAAHDDDTHYPLDITGIDIDVESQDWEYIGDTSPTPPFNSAEDSQPTVVDARLATFILANSTLAVPTNSDKNATGGCNDSAGTLELNRYPIHLDDDDETHFVGGIINGEVPMTSDRENTYCNSAAIIAKNNDDAKIDGVRITKSWDAIRPANGSDRMKISNVWISDVRDDAIENDSHHELELLDTLIDGTFHAISVRGGHTTQSTNIVTIQSSLIKMDSFPYDDHGTGNHFGSLTKNETTSPYINIHGSVIAVDPGDAHSDGTANWPRTWQDIKDAPTTCTGNTFLWLDDSDPDDMSGLDHANIPACFTTVTDEGGSAASDAWAIEKQDWIDCHPLVEHATGDPTGDINSCSRSECH